MTFQVFSPSVHDNDTPETEAGRGPPDTRSNTKDPTGSDQLHLADPTAVFQLCVEIPEMLKAWKAGIVDVLKKIRFKNRKFLRWKTSRVYLQPDWSCYFRKIMEVGELEMLPEPST